MNLIKKMGLETCKQIVDGAPETATVFCDGKFYEEWSHNGWVVSTGDQWKDCKKPTGTMIKLDSLRTALADHDSKPCSHGYDIACLICGFGTEDGVRVWRKQIETDNVTDIRNHISPNTKVIEHESNKNTV